MGCSRLLDLDAEESGEWEYEYPYPETPETPETPRTIPGAENYYKIPPVTENIEPPIPYQKMIVLHAL